MTLARLKRLGMTSAPPSISRLWRARRGCQTSLVTTAGRHVADLPEQKGKDRDRGKWLEDHLSEADGSLLIAHGNVAHHQSDEHLAPAPEFERIDQPKATRRLDHVHVAMRKMFFDHGNESWL
jgi:hypothetical protein